MRIPNPFLVAVAVSAAILLIACGGGGSGSGSGGGSTSQPTPTLPVITSFTPSPPTIPTGQSITLTAMFSGGTGVLTYGNITEGITSGQVMTLSPTTTTIYTITVSSSGVSVSQSTTVAVTGSGPSLSADQAVFEFLALHSGTNPSAAYNIGWNLPTTGTPVAGTNYLDQQSYSMTTSPLTAGSQTVTFSTPASISATLGLPASLLLPNRYLVNGQILVGSGPGWQVTISYPGSGVQFDYLAADGKTVVSSQSRSGFILYKLSTQSVPLAVQTWFGVLNSNSLLTNNSDSGFVSGSACMEFTDTQITDVYLVYDYNGSTVGNTPNPVASGTTIAALMAGGGILSNSDGTTYTLALGMVSVINGVHTYVATNPRPNQITTAYRTFYELNDNVYTGEVIKAGTNRPGNGTFSNHIEVNQPFEVTLKESISF